MDLRQFGDVLINGISYFGVLDRFVPQPPEEVLVILGVVVFELIEWPDPGERELLSARGCDNGFCSLKLHTVRHTPVLEDLRFGKKKPFFRKEEAKIGYRHQE